MPARRRTHAGASTSAAAANDNAINDANNRPQMVEDAGIERASLACGDCHTVVVTSDGAVYTWGRGEYGQLGHGDASDQHTPTRVEALASVSVRALACGSRHTAALTSDGAVYTWGHGAFGELGHSDTSSQLTPTRVDALASVSVRALACGVMHMAALTSDGAVYMSGYGDYGQLGHGDGSDQHTPKRVDALASVSVRALACGSMHTVALTSDGAVYTWGHGAFGELGHGDGSSQLTPKRVDALASVSVRALACSGSHTAALTSDGAVYTWGRGAFGQLGHGDTSNQLTPTRVDALASVSVRALACGGRHIAALTSDGAVYTWGNGAYGQLGHGDDTSSQHTPTRVDALASVSVRALGCGHNHTAALTSDGAVYTWGRGEYGRLGHGDEDNQHTPKRVDALPPIAIDVHQSSAIPTVESFHIEDRSDEELGKLAQFASRLRDAADAEIDRRICDALAHEHDEYVCPITQAIMTDPVCAADGHSYERSAIERWLGEGNSRSPKTNLQMAHTHLNPNQALLKGIRGAMEEAREAWPQPGRRVRARRNM
ncbi:U-box domain-containing protein [Pseudoscourfieldia marina]